MANPTTTLFNAGSIPAGWTAITKDVGDSVSVGGAGGRGMLTIYAAGVGPWYAVDHVTMTQLEHVVDAGDFDFVWVGTVENPNLVVNALAGLSISLHKDPPPGVSHMFGLLDYVQLCVGAVSFDGATYVVADYVPPGSFSWVSGVGSLVLVGDTIRRFALRVKRTGSTLAFYQQTPSGGWYLIKGGITDQFSGGACRIGLHCGAGLTSVWRAFLVLTAGAIAAPSAPTGGLAFSAPSADDSDLGIGFRWDAPPSNVARTVEILTATNSGFTTGITRHVVDMLMDGEKPSHRRGGLSVGNTIYAKARFIDELGQAGAWSAEVHATAAVYPTLAPTYQHPIQVLRTPDQRRIVRMR